MEGQQESEAQGHMKSEGLADGERWRRTHVETGSLPASITPTLPEALPGSAGISLPKSPVGRREKGVLRASVRLWTSGAHRGVQIPWSVAQASHLSLKSQSGGSGWCYLFQKEYLFKNKMLPFLH